MRIGLISIPVLDQQKALEFYRDKLGFQLKVDKDLGGGHRWLVLVSASDPKGPELLLEPAPLHFEPSKVFQEALFNAGIPFTQFDVDDVEAEYQRLKGLGVEFSAEPKVHDLVKFAVLKDTCGNHIQLVEHLPSA